MYQPLSPIDHVSYLEQQSERKFKRRVEYPQAGQKSPTRQCENKNILSNRPFTPAKKGATINGSPLKTNSSIVGSNLPKAREMTGCSIKKSRMSNHPTAKESHTCHNHPSKTARYIIETEDEEIPYCQKCSILLASQGFKVVKLEEQQTAKVQSSFSNAGKELVQLDDLERENELNQFLNSLHYICSHLKQKKVQTQAKIAKVAQSSQEQVNQIQTYFKELWEVIKQYKTNMILNVTKHQDAQTQALKKFNEEVEECLEDAHLMKQDILSSLEIIQQVEDKMFRKVMQSYKQREQSFREQLMKPQPGSSAQWNAVFLTDGYKIQCVLQELADLKTLSAKAEPKQMRQEKSMSSQNQNPIIQQQSEEELLLKNNISNNQSYFKQFE